MSVDEINEAVKLVDTNKVSDGYHTFEELYEHRIALYIALCKAIKDGVWVSKAHSDGSIWPEWFIMGIGSESGNQITYHLPMYMWGECADFAEIKDKAPEWDGHTSADVLTRIKQLKQ